MERVKSVEAVPAPELALGPLPVRKVTHLLSLELARDSEDVTVLDQPLTHLSVTAENIIP